MGMCENGGDGREGERRRAKGGSGGTVCVYLWSKWVYSGGDI